jgi:hypothetical protein
LLYFLFQTGSYTFAWSWPWPWSSYLFCMLMPAWPACFLSYSLANFLPGLAFIYLFIFFYSYVHTMFGSFSPLSPPPPLPTLPSPSPPLPPGYQVWAGFDWNPPISASQVAENTGMNHHTQPLRLGFLGP